MADATKEKLIKFILFAYLALFPFGQIIRFNLIHPTDILAGILFLFWLCSDYKRPEVYKFFKNFFILLCFSFLFSLTIFPIEKLLIGLLYSLRLVSYGSIIFVVWNLVRKDKSFKGLLFNSLITISLATAVFGWIQYFFYPDLRALKFFAWDDHLYRLVGAFLDPGFTAIILVMGAILAYAKRSWLILLVLMLSILFTYSRASYLAFAAGLTILAFLKKDFLKGLVFSLLFIFLIFILPRPSSEGVKLERLSSVYPRLSNYQETLEIIKKYPVFGVGFDNLCAYKNLSPSESHSCAGSDASLLTLFATAGIVGLILFIYLIAKIFASIDIHGMYGMALTASFSALFVNSLFINSLFYPWMMGWMAILLGTSIKPKG